MREEGAGSPERKTLDSNCNDKRKGKPTGKVVCVLPASAAPTSAAMRVSTSDSLHVS